MYNFYNYKEGLRNFQHFASCSQDKLTFYKIHQVLHLKFCFPNLKVYNAETVAYILIISQIGQSKYKFILVGPYSFGS